MGVCEQLCGELGGSAGVILNVIVLGRWLWAEWQRRKLSGKTAVLSVANAELQGQVKQLSLRPPPLASVPNLEELVAQLTGRPSPPPPPGESMPPPAPDRPDSPKE